MTQRILKFNEVARSIGCSRWYLRRVRIAMGLPKCAKRLDPEQVKAWLREHQEFRSTQVRNGCWHRPTEADHSPGAEHKSGEPAHSHD